MTCSIYDPGLFQRYLRPFEQRLANLQAFVRRLPNDHPDRQRYAEGVRHLKLGIGDLKAEYAERNTARSGKTHLDRMNERMDAIQRKLDDLASQSARSAESTDGTQPVSLSRIASPSLQSRIRPSPTRWEQITILVLSEERLRIQVGTENETYNYAEFGFEDSRTGKPNRAWKMLLALAGKRGMVSETRVTAKEIQWTQVEKRMQEIRKLFRSFFGISSDPIQFMKNRKEPGYYQTQFKISCLPAFKT